MRNIGTSLLTAGLIILLIAGKQVSIPCALPETLAWVTGVTPKWLKNIACAFCTDWLTLLGHRSPRRTASTPKFPIHAFRPRKPWH